jgi:hypothetical protein
MEADIVSVALEIHFMLTQLRIREDFRRHGTSNVVVSDLSIA